VSHQLPARKYYSLKWGISTLFIAVIFVVINEEVLRNLFTMKKDNG
jgi:hypothetical protein